MSRIVYEAALARARTDAFRQLMETLLRRELEFAELQDELPDRIMRLRAEHESRPVVLSPQQKRTIRNAARDARIAEEQMRQLLATVDSEDMWLEISRDGEKQDLDALQSGYDSYPDYARPLVRHLMDHKRETLAIVTAYSTNS